MLCMNRFRAPSLLLSNRPSISLSRILKLPALCPRYSLFVLPTLPSPLCKWMARSLVCSLFSRAPVSAQSPALALYQRLGPASAQPVTVLTAPGSPPAYRDRDQLSRSTLSLVTLSPL